MEFNRARFISLRNPIVTIVVASVACGMLACGVCSAQTEPSPRAHGASSQSAPAASKRVYKRKSAGELVTGYGIPMGFSSFVAPDGIGLFVMYLRQDDLDLAAEAFRQELGKAINVTKRGQKKDRNGKIVGDRAEILTPAAPPRTPDHAVIWTDGPTFHMIASSSLQDVLGLEKVYGH